jgi:hypothetical protein
MYTIAVNTLALQRTKEAKDTRCFDFSVIVLFAFWRFVCQDNWIAIVLLFTWDM